MLRFVTTNEGKLTEAQSYLETPIEQGDYDYTEIQADEPTPIAVDGARKAFKHFETPVLVDDAGLYIQGVGGFPGPYSAFVEETIGIEAVADLAITADARQAAFRSVIGYATTESVPTPDAGTVHAVGDGLTVVTFEGRVEGRIVRPRGDGGFGYDPIFEYEGQTLAERSTAAKNAISHRGRALEQLAEWYNSLNQK